MADMSYVPMTQAQLFMCCTLFLHADNSMPTNVDAPAYSAWLDQCAQALGFTSWLDFYHGYEISQPVSAAPIEGTTEKPEVIE